MASKDVAHVHQGKNTQIGLTEGRDGIGSVFDAHSIDTVSGDDDVEKLLSALNVVQKQDQDVKGKRLLSGEKGNPAQGKSIKRTGNVELERKYSVLEAERNDLKNKLEKLLTEKKTREHKLVKVTAKLKEAEQESRQQRSEILRLKQITEPQAVGLKHEPQKIADLKEELKSMERKLQEQTRARDEAEKAKEDAMTRLSRHIGQQMSDGNPNITDLSDQNRPSKLAERYSELYNNEWTNAFEVLTTKFYLEDKKAIEILRTIVHVGPECRRLLREARKHVDIKKADDFFKGFINKTLDTSIVAYMKETVMTLFAKECFQLCWFMSIQDPPVVLAKNPDHGDHFDTNMYKHYTITGDEVDYVVWPAVLLHEKGPLLVKGVAQPIPESKRSAKSAPVADRFKDRTDLTRQEGSVQNIKPGADKAHQNQGIDDHLSAVEDNYNQSATRTDSNILTGTKGQRLRQTRHDRV